jgi:hypothetical protein
MPLLLCTRSERGTKHTPTTVECTLIACIDLPRALRMNAVRRVKYSGILQENA